MWIKALRLNEVGRFAAGHVVDGLQPGLNVLIGSNEYGKSTLLRALRVLFEFPHTSNHASVRGLRPYAGGAPQIACEFSLAGEDWSLSKQYLTSRSAELRCLSGRQVYRGGDVDSALAELIETAAGSIATLKSQWVPQGDGFRPPKAATETVTTIQQLVADEASAATGTDQLEAVFKSVSDQLAQLVTAKSRKPKTGGPLHEAQRELLTLTQTLEEVRQKEAAGAQRLARFNEIAAATHASEHGGGLMALKQQVAEQRQEIEAAQAKLAQCALVTERRKRQTAELEAADNAVAAFADRVREFEERRARLCEIDQQLSDLSTAKQDAHGRLERLLSHAAELEKKQERFRRSELARQQQQRLADLTVRLGELRQRLQAASDLSEKIGAIATQLQSAPLQKETRDQALALQQDIDRLSIELNAQSATLQVEYLPDRPAPFTVDGQELVADVEIAVEEPVVVTAPGVGRLRISPGRNQQIAKLRERYQRERATLAQVLAESGFETVDQIETAWQQQEQLATERRHLSDRLAQLCPEGEQRLVEALSQLEAQVEELQPEDPTQQEGLDNEPPADHAEELRDTSEELKSVQYEIARQDERERQLKSERHELHERTERASDQEVFDAELRNKKSGELNAAAGLARENLNLVVRQEHALLEVTPSERDVAEQVQRLEQAEHTLRSREDELRKLQEEGRILEGALRRDAEEGLGVQVQEIADQQAVAQARVDELLLEVAALELLEQELAVIAGDQRRSLTQPVVRRVSHIAEPLFGAAAFGFSDGLELDRVRRDGLEETIDAISDGTREQIGVVARLAFAELLADGGHPLPLILDDPFAFSDDQRLAEMFQILEGQAKSHQIIILTCHKNTFEPLITRFAANSVGVEQRSD